MKKVEEVNGREDRNVSVLKKFLGIIKLVPNACQTSVNAVLFLCETSTKPVAFSVKNRF